MLVRVYFYSNICTKHSVEVGQLEIQLLIFRWSICITTKLGCPTTLNLYTVPQKHTMQTLVSDEGRSPKLIYRDNVGAFRIRRGFWGVLFIIIVQDTPNPILIFLIIKAPILCVFVDSFRALGQKSQWVGFQTFKSLGDSSVSGFTPSGGLMLRAVMS